MFTQTGGWALHVQIALSAFTVVSMLGGMLTL